MSVGAVLQLMTDRAYPQFTLERSEDRFDLRQLHVARPQDAWVSGSQVGAQQVANATPVNSGPISPLTPSPKHADQLLLLPTFQQTCRENQILWIGGSVEGLLCLRFAANDADGRGTRQGFPPARFARPMTEPSPVCTKTLR
jgi:hypothetical protein